MLIEYQPNLPKSTPVAPAQAAKITAITILTFSLLILRCALDIIVPGAKPTVAVVIYLLLMTVIVVMEVLRSNIKIVDAVLVILLPVTTIAGMINSPYEIMGQLNFGSQCFATVIFLLILSRSKSLDFDRLRYLFLRYGTVVIVGCAIYAIGRPGAEAANALAFFNDNPMHTMAQVIAKAALIFVGPITAGAWFPLAGAAAAVFAIAALNVRSTLLGLFISFAASSRRFVVLGVVGALTIACLVFVDILAVQELIERLLFRGRDFLGESIGNLSSGRTDRIWPYYLERLTSASFLELMFGQGALWLFSSMVLFPHNDLLTLVVAYGLSGLALYSVSWFIIFSRVVQPYQVPVIVLFIILAMTNGVVSYQSNVLFILFCGGGTVLAKRGSEQDGEIANARRNGER